MLLYYYSSFTFLKGGHSSSISAPVSGVWISTLNTELVFSLYMKLRQLPPELQNRTEPSSWLYETEMLCL